MKRTISVICLICLLIIPFILLSCSNCTNGIDAACGSKCSQRLKSDTDDCKNLYGSTNTVMLNQCIADAKEKYDDCYLNCPCAN